jgi:hypothetical protein
LLQINYTDRSYLTFLIQFSYNLLKRKFNKILAKFLGHTGFSSVQSFDQGSMIWSQFSAIFDNFLRKKKLAFFLKTNIMINILHNLHSFVLSQKRPLFWRIFRWKYFKNHNIGPRERCYDLKNIFSKKFCEKIGVFLL